MGLAGTNGLWSMEKETSPPMRKHYLVKSMMNSNLPIDRLPDGQYLHKGR